MEDGCVGSVGVSGRGIAQATPALVSGSRLMIDDAEARLNGGLGVRASARLVFFNQDSETLRGSEQAGQFRPPDRPRVS